jgi:tetratricopeptide (TPR) repeat protein
VEVRYWGVILAMSATAGAAAAEPSNADAAAQWELEGRFLFLACQFKQAARAFEKALAEQPDNAALHYRLGKSYARLAEVSSPLSAPKYARKARRNLEQAVMIAPRNAEYLLELFDFDVESPEWLGGGLERAAALLERIGPGDSGAESRSKQLADAREEHRGAGWWVRRAALWTAGVIGRFLPLP